MNHDKYLYIQVAPPLTWVGFKQEGDLSASLEAKVHEWPRKAHFKELKTTLFKYGGTATFTQQYHMDTMLEVQVGPYELTYRQSPEGWFELIGANIGGGLTSVQPSYTPTPDPEPSHHWLAQKLYRVMPGLKSEVDRPCRHEGKGTIWGVIQHLNDSHHPDSESDDVWTRERIAQWSENLPVDLTIDPELAEKVRSQPAIDEVQASKHQEAVKAAMESMVVSHESFMKTMNTSFDKIKEACKGAQDALAHVEFHADSTQMQETLQVEWEKMNPKEDT